MTALTMGLGQEKANGVLPSDLPPRTNSIPADTDGHHNGGLKLPA
jgi:hypothetical protein